MPPLPAERSGDRPDASVFGAFLYCDIQPCRKRIDTRTIPSTRISPPRFLFRFSSSFIVRGGNFIHSPAEYAA